jgi:chromosome segregation ATPase
MSAIEAMHETEKLELQQRVRDTKEEAKRRIQKAKERVQAMEEQLHNVTSSQSTVAEEASKQAGLVAALREEGEKLALKQADMEKAVRTAKGEARELRVQLEDETIAKEDALEKIAKLEAELKTTKEDLTSARKGESQADKLEEEVRKSKEDANNKAATILSLEQQLKELKSEKKELKEQLEEAQKGAAIESQREQKKMARERNDAVTDLENKLRAIEREAAVREDALRHEVAELRKRWQDAVRRADTLSMDVQSSTAPLLRQL